MSFKNRCFIGKKQGIITDRNVLNKDLHRKLIMNRKYYIMLIISLFVFAPMHKSCAMAALTQKLHDWYGSYSPQEQEYLDELDRLKAISDRDAFEAEITRLSLSNLVALRNFVIRRGLEWTYPQFMHEFDAQLILKSGQEHELLKEQVESLYDMVRKGDFSVLLQMPLREKKRYMNYIEQFRKEYDSHDAYEELYKLLGVKDVYEELHAPLEAKKVEAVAPQVAEYYPTTIQTLLKTEDYQPVPTHIINLNAVELAGPKCQVTKNVHVGIEDYHILIEQLGSLPEYLDEIPKEVTFETLCNPLIAQRQIQNECGLMSIYNALQLYNLLNNKIDQATFEQNLTSFNLDEWIQEVESCPIDTNDIINIMARRAHGIGKNQYTIIPTIVDNHGRLAHTPLKNRSIVTLANGDIEANLDQDASLLHAIQNIHNENVPTYTHIFFLNNLQIGAQGAAMRHWIPVVLHKENNQLYLYTVNSQSVFREDLMDPSDKVVDLETLARIVEKDNGWLQALTELLSINPDALARGLAIAYDLYADDYNHDYIPDILDAIKDEHSALADQIRAMLIR